MFEKIKQELRELFKKKPTKSEKYILVLDKLEAKKSEFKNKDDEESQKKRKVLEKLIKKTNHLITEHKKKR